MVAFRDRRRAPDWNQVAQAREIDEVVRNGDNGLEDIQTLLDNITFCNLRRDSARQSHDLIIKGFEYAQLTIEYLLNVQEQLSSALAKSQEELEEQTARVEEVTRNERIQERRARTGAKKLRNCQSTLQAASRMLVQFGVDTTPLRRMSEEDQMDGAPAPEYVWVPAYLDPYDGKAWDFTRRDKRERQLVPGVHARGALAADIDVHTALVGRLALRQHGALLHPVPDGLGLGL